MLTAGANSHTLARRQEALAALGTMGANRRAVRLVEAALSDKDPSVRQLAAQNLGEMHARSSIPKLKAALDDESAEVSFAAARSLWQMGDHSGRDVFMQILAGDRSSSSGMVKGQVQNAKKQLQDPRALAIIGAKEAAGSLFGPAGWGIKIVEEVTKDRSASARAMSAALLGRDPTPEALQELDDALGEKNWLIRSAAAQALGGTGRREQVALLEPLLEDQKPAVRYMAAASILRLSTVPASAAPVPGSPSKSPAPAVAPPTPSTSRKDTR